MELNTSLWYMKNYTNETWAYINNFLTKEECEKLDSYLAKNIKLTEGATESEGVNESIRKGQIGWLNSNDKELEWIFRKCVDGASLLNEQFWNFKLDYIEALQYTLYDSEGAHYKEHIDMMAKVNHNRKLSFSIQLSNPENYQGGDLLVHNGLELGKTIREQGALIVFPSYILHQVTPIISGQRNSLVGWIAGPKFT